MSTPAGKTESCSEIIASIEKQASEGVRFPISEATKFEQQLQICLEQRKITQAEFNALIELMKTR
ncbi:MAG TPA: hypothetical protein VIY49_37075 [Bryobacteraceae bacterium]